LITLGTIPIIYDCENTENRLVRKGDVAYTHDRDGNMLSEAGLWTGRSTGTTG
jgi:hypothetical protein